MDEQDFEPNQDIDRSLRKLIGGLTQNNAAEMYEGYKALFQVGAPAIPKIRGAVLKSNWSKLKYPNEMLKNVPIEDLKEIDRIYILRSEDLNSRGTYTPILYVIDLVWDNPSSRWSPMSWVNNFIIESVLYHEIGHHVHRHSFWLHPDQEKEADKYSDSVMTNSNHLLFSICRLLRRGSNNSLNQTSR